MHPNISIQHLKHKEAVLDSSFYASLQKSPEEPGYYTLAITWHDCCHIAGDIVKASENCVSPVPKILYRTVMRLFAEF